MKIRPALAGVALLSAALTGCAAHPKPAASAAASTDPKAALASSVAGITAGRYHYDVTFPYAHLSGSIDKVGHQAQWTSTMENQPGRIVHQEVVIGEDEYVTEWGGGGLGSGKRPLTVGAWEHFDLSRQSADEDPLSDPDDYITAFKPLLKTVNATSANGRTVHGTMTLSAYRSPSPEMSMLTQWAGPTPLPVTVTLDDQGRLAELTAALPATGNLAPAGRLTIKLSAYGATIRPAPRPTVTSEAPATVYQ